MEENCTMTLNISVKSSILQLENFKENLYKLVKEKFEKTSYNDEGFITKVANVKPVFIKVDHVSAELDVKCKCSITILRVTSESEIPILLSIVKPEAVRGEMVDNPDVQILIPRKDLTHNFKIGDIIVVRPFCVRYEPQKVSSRGTFVKILDPQKKASVRK